MSYASCQNPNCPSYGKPHPNCKCTIQMAAGGVVPAKDPSDAEEELPAGFQVINQKTKKSDEELPEGFQVQDAEAENPTDAEEELPAGFQVQDAEAESGLPAGFELAPSKYATPTQQAATLAEGIVQGIPFVGPAATAAQTKLSDLGVPGMSAEDIKGRAEENPTTHMAGKAIGLAGSLIPTLGAGAGATLGAAALRGFLGNAAIQGSDEATNWILGQTDPEAPVASSLTNMAASGLFGLAGGALGFSAAKKLGEIANKNVGSNIAPFLEGVAEAAAGRAPENMGPTQLAGANFYNHLTSSFLPHMTGAIGAVEGGRHGYDESGVPGLVTGAVKGGVTGELSGVLGRYLIGKLTKSIGEKAVAPFVAKILSSGTADGIGDAINYATDVGRGLNKMNTGVDALFTTGKVAPQQIFSDTMMKENRARLKDYIDNGGYQQDIDATHEQQNTPTPAQGYAEGGEVRQKPKMNRPNRSILQDNDGVALHFPDQNTLLTMAKSRISNYLTSVKPQNLPSALPFDTKPDNKKQEKSYNRALDIANDPMSILQKVQTGRLVPEDLDHFRNLYPEIASSLNKKITEKIVQSQVDGKKPSYKIRQGMSMLMGTPLSSELTPQGIRAAQATFAVQNGATNPPKNRSNLSKISANYMTGNEAEQKEAQTPDSK